MNKATVRLIRKFFKVEFKKQTSYIRKKSMKMRIKQFQNATREMTERLVDSSTKSDIQNLDSKILFEVVGMITNPTMFKKLPDSFKSSESKEIREFVKYYDSCCTSYSHIAFEHITNNRFFKILFSIFYSKVSREFIEKNKRTDRDTEIFYNNFESINKAL